MNSFKIGKCEISEDSGVVVIAEAAVEHLGSLNAAKRMADAAKESGADIIKYQIHLPEFEMLSGKIKFWGGSLDQILEDYNLSNDDHVKLIEYCDSIDIQYLCTPFCPEAVDVLDEMGVSGFKTGSGEMRNEMLFERIAATGKPVIVSSGMSTEAEIEKTISFLREHSVDFAITHCTSIYPAPYESINLEYLKTLKEKFNIIVGHSDHTPTIWTALGAVMNGAKILEKHFTLTRRMRGPDYEVSLEPEEMKKLVEGVRALELARGTGEKQLLEEEKVVRDWAHHSIVSTENINSGDVLSKRISM